MNEELLINLTPSETRVALVENGVLQEVYIERSQKRGIVGNIYKGKVVRVLPGMQAAFIDLGLEKAAFIHLTDIHLATQAEENQEQATNPPCITSLLREGQTLVVQVTKDPIGTKGARLTSNLALPSRYLVYMPASNHLGISQRIEQEEERERLKSLVEKCAAQLDLKGGYILRTAAEGASEEELQADMEYLHRVNLAIERRIKRDKAPAKVFEDLPLFMRSMRDFVRPSLERIRIDSKENYVRLKDFVEEFIPELSNKVEYYPGERPIFDLYSVEDEIHRALKRKVQLKSGGYLVIDQTEAMTTIDVNTGAFVGHRNLEETIFKTNLEAANALVRQLRLRNIGGIIIVDFIDMQDVEHQRQVLRLLESNLEKDHTKTKLTGVTELGLVQITRKRSRENLEQVLCETCPTCDGRGRIKSAETLCYEILRDLLRIHRAYKGEAYLVMANQEVVDRFLDEESAAVADLEEFIGKSIRFQVDSHYHQEYFDIVFQ